MEPATNLFLRLIAVSVFKTLHKDDHLTDHKAQSSLPWAIRGEDTYMMEKKVVLTFIAYLNYSNGWPKPWLYLSQVNYPGDTDNL